MALHVDDLRASFDTDGWRLANRCLPILHDLTAEPVGDFARACTGHVVYRFYGYDGRLLYIGVTKDLHARCTYNRHGRKPWWGHVAFATVENAFKDRREAEAAESSAIWNEYPRATSTSGTAAIDARLDGSRSRWPDGVTG